MIIKRNLKSRDLYFFRSFFELATKEKCRIHFEELKQSLVTLGKNGIGQFNTLWFIVNSIFMIINFKVLKLDKNG